MSKRIDIYVKDDKILKYLQRKDRSAYICNLVEQDMQNNKYLTKQEVIDLILEYTNSPTTIKKSVKQLFD